MDPEQVVRNAYAVAERKDIDGWVSAFTDDGVFIDNSIGMAYRGPNELGKTVVNFATAFSDMHRELYNFWTDGNTVIVRLALQGTNDGPLEMPFGVLPPTGKRMDAPCADIWTIEGDKVKVFDCYPEGTMMLAQLGVLTDLDAAVTH